MDELNNRKRITQVEIGSEVKKSFIDYAMSVIVDRALPDVRDGLKPVHRRILYAMKEDGLTYNKPFRKSATTVGNVLGHYHPHGDASVYDALVRLAQPFSLRYPLVEGHGNFGNIDGDGAAAYRYTEARMARLADEMLSDIDKNVVDFIPNFDNKLTEPSVLPSRFPNILVNGSVGIAVGMATNIPPHNMSEVIDGAIHLMYHPDADVTELMNFIKGPDFPTYATIHGTAGIYEAYMTGRGKVYVRAKADFEEHGGRTSIIVSELPYQVNKANLVMNIAELVKDKRIEGISDIRDESGKNGMRIVIEIKREANPNVVLNLLYKYTQLQDTFAINMLALVNGEPKTLNLKQILHHYIEHQTTIVRRRTQFDLDRAKARAHVVEGLKIAIDNIDEFIKIIRYTPGGIPEVKQKLIERFDLTEIQATEIVQMPLGKLSGLEIDKLLDELDSLHKKIAELTETLASETSILDIVRDELLEIKRKYGDERRTKIEAVENEIVLEDLIERKDYVITISHLGYIKRMPVDTYTAQKRGGKGISAMSTKEEDFVENLFIANSHNYIMMFSNHGKVFVKKAYEIPEFSRTAKGTNLVNIIDLAPDETITAYIPLESINEKNIFLTMITKKGIIKRTSLELYKNIRKNGLIAINIVDGDELLFVLKTAGESNLLIATHKGLAVYFDENDARPLGRSARGVRAINLSSGDYVVGAVAAGKANDARRVLTITENGLGKRTELSEYTVHNRGGKGMKCHNLTEKTGLLNGIALVDDENDVMLITNTGTIIRTHVSGISVIGRTASGVRVMRTGDDVSITNFTVVEKNDDEDAEDAETSAENADETADVSENAGETAVSDEN
ncbi:MAG: DNA gyrase subunit A [Clostridia bacterium]|nr:DNA gyrase subunit A [Clostridia bacterium]